MSLTNSKMRKWQSSSCLTSSKISWQWNNSNNSYQILSAKILTKNSLWGFEPITNLITHLVGKTGMGFKNICVPQPPQIVELELIRTTWELNRLLRSPVHQEHTKTLKTTQACNLFTDPTRTWWEPALVAKETRQINCFIPGERLFSRALIALRRCLILTTITPGYSAVPA
jgi:hypothetical protein